MMETVALMNPVKTGMRSETLECGRYRGTPAANCVRCRNWLPTNFQIPLRNCATRHQPIVYVSILSMT